MKTKQQNETLNYFDKFAGDWKEKALGNKDNQVNIINQRNDYVLEVIKARGKNSKTLDVGCGTGELVHEIGKLNINAIGIDFAAEMVRLAKEIAANENIKNTDFTCASVFDFEMDNDSLDVLSANGFIEYISHSQFDMFITKAHSWLKKDGSFVFGSRNRLFNLFSMNQYTVHEITNNHIEKLLKEAVHIANLSELSELINFDAVPLENPEKVHTNTGIDVSTRYQFTPAQLATMLNANGFEVKELCPIHIHGVIPAFASEHKDVHYNVSNLLSQVGDSDKQSRNKLIPLASSFMIHAVKK